jgi:protease-4
MVENRPGLDKTKLIEVYGANIYPAQTAKEYGYIDENGHSLSQTLEVLAQKIGIQDDYYQVISLESNSWLSQLFKGECDLLKGRMTHQIELTPELPSKLQGQFLYLFRP